MRESALFGTMFGLGAGAVLVGVTVSRLVVGQASDKAVEGPPAAVAETAPRAVVEAAPPAAVEPSPPAAVSSVAPPHAGMAMAGQHRPLPRKHRRPPAVEEAARKTAPVARDNVPTASIAKREAPTAVPPPAEKAAPKAAPVVQEPAPPPSIAKREAPTAAPPAAEKAAPVVQEPAPPGSIAKREEPTAAPPPAEKAAPKAAPVVQEPVPPASVASREAPTAVPPPRAEVTDAPFAPDAPIAIVRGGVARPESQGPGARIIQVEPQGR
jgi:hypothetical protein